MLLPHASLPLYVKATVMPTVLRKTIFWLASLLIIMSWGLHECIPDLLGDLNVPLLIDVITIFVGLHMQHEGFTENWSWITHEGKLRTNNFYTCSKF